MDIWISNLDARTTKDQLKHLLTPTLQRLKIEVFELRKRNDKPHGSIIISDITKAQNLLSYTSQRATLVKSPSGRYARFSVNKHPADPQLLRVLQKEEKDLKNRQDWQKMAKQNLDATRDAEENKSLTISSLECGRWETTTGGKSIFTPYFFSTCGGSLIREARALKIKMNTSDSQRHDLFMDISNIHSLALSKINTARTLTITLALAPKFFEEDLSNADDMLAAMLASLTTGTTNKKTNSRYRVTGLPGADPALFGSCLSYRLTFRQDISGFKSAIQKVTSHQISIIRTQELSMRGRINSFEVELANLNRTVNQYNCSFGWKFQIQALCVNGLISPHEVQRMLPAMQSLRSRSGEAALIKVIQRLTLQLPIPDATTNTQGGLQGAITALTQQEEYLLHEDFLDESKRDEVFVHRAVVTPTGIYLSGPEAVAANRILRQYRANQDCFLRVLFADENEERLEFDRDFSNERILQGRFLTILRKGLDIAGQHFDFLGFSHSSLRSQTCWFMRPFIHRGSLLFAGQLISQLGDFTAIHCPAKCAARIGQAFSESISAVQVDPAIVKIFPDVKAGRYTFTDGCGTMSRKSWRTLRGGSSSKKNQPTSYQIRYKGRQNRFGQNSTNVVAGVKGMLSLDSSLEGHQIRLRESMVKFTGSPSNEVEICGTNARPLPFKLNRQLIKILEDLGISAAIFETLQEQAIHKLRLSARSTKSAIDFMGARLSDTSNGLPTLLKCLQNIGIDVTEDSFLREVLGALLQVQLRDIKYRSRIPVPNALTVYGISDETAWLKEGEVFVTFASEDFKRHLHLNGQVAITRSPALHPGDIQLANAVIPPKDSSLWDLHNCILFNQKGGRDLPSMLSGGDLDGDLFNVIYDEDLIPQTIESPAAYLPAQPVDIGRTVTTADMTEFFIDFMQNDQLGRIATLHQVFADEKGTKSAECLLLAELHSTVVDFSKSGVPVDVKKIPKAPPFRPDFMAPSASTKVEKGVKRPAEMAAPEGNQRYRYYESNNVLGKLYRAVDEDIFFRDLEHDAGSIFSKEAADTALGEILEWVEGQIDAGVIMEYASIATEARNYYEVTLLEIMSRYTVHRNDWLTEKEVFTGTILGRSGAGSRYQREQSDYMRSRFNWELRDLKSWMERQTHGDEEDFVYLAAACLHHAVNKKSNIDEKLSSFGWIAAAMCVPALFERTEGFLSNW